MFKLSAAVAAFTRAQSRQMECWNAIINRKWSLTASTVVGAAGAMLPGQVLAGMGFTSLGPAAGSWAAYWMSIYGGAGQPTFQALPSLAQS